VVALIVSLQPLLTAALAGTMLGERVSGRQWLGFALGFVGVALVVASKLAWDGQHLFGAATAMLSLLAITVGTLYQKRFCAHMDLLSGTVIQNAVAGVLVLTGAFLFEDMHVAWSASFVFALLWLCFVLSVGATLLLFVLLRRGAASRVASFFYLVPPVTAVMAYLFFGETLGVAALLGMGLVMAGVVLVNRG
jgi:drug/metabolite transporter (DMT)-like permease